MEPTQADRQASISTPLGDDKLLLRRFSGREQLGRMFRYELELLSTDPDIKLSDLLGHPVTVSMTMPDDGTRYFHGFVTSFALIGHSGRFHVYSATVEPWLWFLTRTADSRIFPEKNGQDKVPQIIMGIFREHGFSDFEDKLQRSYKPREHCVQYRETDFNFVMRLMEDEGIYFWFKHEDGKHTMMLCDDYGSHEAIEGYEEVPCHLGADRRDIEYLDSWSVRESVQAGMVALNDHDFMRPNADLQVKSKVARDHEFADFEVYDYPGEYVDPADGEAGDKAGNDDLKSAFEQVAKTRIEELHTQFESAEGGGNVKGLYAGGLFSMMDHPRDDQNREYLIVFAQFELEGDSYGSEGGGGGQEFSCGLTAIDATTPFRSQRLTPKPTIQGIQTATVVGPSSEKIHTDKYGRVKLQFPWDRYGESDENSSCWVRVSQARAGKNWGEMHLPHIGQEVVVSFLEGDPDRPLVIGRVYNEDHMPPKTLPDEKHVSIIRDDFGNQLIFDGTPGEEHIALFSPSKTSGLILGQSQYDVTWSSKKSMVYGTRYSQTRGDSVKISYGKNYSFKKSLDFSIALSSSISIGAGTQVSVFGGMKLGATLGTDISFAVGTKVAFGFTRSIRTSKSDYARTSTKDIKHDSDAEVWLCGGPDDASLVKAAPKELTLTFGKGSPRPSIKDLGVWGTVAAAAGALIGTAGQAWSIADAKESVAEETGNSWTWNTARDQATNDVNSDDLSSGGASWALEGVGYAGAVAGAVAGLVSEEVKDPQHTTEYAKVTLNEKGVAITHAAKGPHTSAAKKPGIKIEAAQSGGKGEIWLKENGDIHIKCSGFLKLQSDDDTIIDGNTVVKKAATFKKKVDTPNISDSG
jgi:type VI secretion system secreted protein VgrG